MVTGEPGSGKTTLGHRLSTTLRVPFLSRDHVRGGLLATGGLWTDQLREPSTRDAALEAFVQVVETVGRLGITAIIEFVVTPERVHGLRRIEAVARCLVIHTTSTTAAARADERDLRDPLLSRREVLDALEYESIEHYVSDPERARLRAAMLTDFEFPTLRVATDDGYDPPLEQIVDWLIDHTGS